MCYINVKTANYPIFPEVALLLGIFWPAAATRRVDAFAKLRRCRVSHGGTPIARWMVDFVEIRT